MIIRHAFLLQMQWNAHSRSSNEFISFLIYERSLSIAKQVMQTTAINVWIIDDSRLNNFADGCYRVRLQISIFFWSKNEWKNCMQFFHLIVIIQKLMTECRFFKHRFYGLPFNQLMCPLVCYIVIYNVYAYWYTMNVKNREKN